MLAEAEKLVVVDELVKTNSTLRERLDVVHTKIEWLKAESGKLTDHME